MLSKRTIIGLIFGIAIITLGGASLIIHTGLHTDDFQDVIEVGALAHYTIPAPNHTPQQMMITGDAFDLKLSSPSTGLQIPNVTSYKNELKLNWVHISDGETKIQIQNTGNTELEITGVITTSYQPEIFTLDLMVMITGVIIIGFSLGFTLRKLKGF
ncbi:MAG: hypothetical protein IIC67_08915 [Thaumarchaeota archaeon]|nr:hypothetical protein [Nitrososphaerota archaeon]